MILRCGPFWHSSPRALRAEAGGGCKTTGLLASLGQVMFLALTSRSTKSTCNLQKRGSATTHATGAGAASIEVASPKPIPGTIHIELRQAQARIESAAEPALVRVLLEVPQAMIALPAKTRIWIAADVTESRVLGARGSSAPNGITFRLTVPQLAPRTWGRTSKAAVTVQPLKTLASRAIRGGECLVHRVHEH